jgi:hypothetical protein
VEQKFGYMKAFHHNQKKSFPICLVISYLWRVELAGFHMMGQRKNLIFSSFGGIDQNLGLGGIE